MRWTPLEQTKCSRYFLVVREHIQYTFSTRIRNEETFLRYFVIINITLILASPVDNVKSLPTYQTPPVYFHLGLLNFRTDIRIHLGPNQLGIFQKTITSDPYLMLSYNLYHDSTLSTVHCKYFHRFDCSKAHPSKLVVPTYLL